MTFISLADPDPEVSLMSTVTVFASVELSFKVRMESAISKEPVPEIPDAVIFSLKITPFALLTSTSPVMFIILSTV